MLERYLDELTSCAETIVGEDVNWERDDSVSNDTEDQELPSVGKDLISQSASFTLPRDELSLTDIRLSSDPSHHTKIIRVPAYCTDRVVVDLPVADEILGALEASHRGYTEFTHTRLSILYRSFRFEYMGNNHLRCGSFRPQRTTQILLVINITPKTSVAEFCTTLSTVVEEINFLSSKPKFTQECPCPWSGVLVCIRRQSHSIAPGVISLLKRMGLRYPWDEPIVFVGRNQRSFGPPYKPGAGSHGLPRLEYGDAIATMYEVGSMSQ